MLTGEGSMKVHRCLKELVSQFKQVNDRIVEVAGILKILVSGNIVIM